MNGIAVLVPVGRIDSETAGQFGRRLNAAIDRGERSLIVDFSALEYISSAGLAALLAGAKRLRPTGGRIRIAGLNDRIRMVFDMAGFTSLFQLFATVEAAAA